MDYKTLNHIDKWITYKFNKTIEIDLLDKINNNLKEINGEITVKKNELNSEKYCMDFTEIRFCKICKYKFICIPDLDIRPFKNTQYWKLCKDKYHFKNINNNIYSCMELICNNCCKKNYNNEYQLCNDCFDIIY